MACVIKKHGEHTVSDFLIFARIGKDLKGLQNVNMGVTTQTATVFWLLIKKDSGQETLTIIKTQISRMLLCHL